MFPSSDSSRMAAIASISPWIPEDDLLLKNAIEAGASLEALAKGAVQFSRKYSVQELRDRWHSLLYDPKIAAKASARMFEFELSSNNTTSSKLNRNGNHKETAELPAKRKAQSIRKKYYAMRKRFRSQPADLTFWGEQNGDGCIIDEGGCQNGNGLPVGNHIDGNFVINQFEFPESGRNSSHHIYPHVGRDIDAANAIGNAINRSHSIEPNSIVDRKPNKVVMEGGENGLAEQVGSLPFVISVKDKGAHSLEHNNITDRDTSVDPRDHTNVDEMELSHEPRDGNESFHLMGASSPQPGMPLWKTIEDVAAPAMPINVGLGDTNHGVDQSLVHHDDGDDSRMDYLAEEGLSFMDVDSKDAMDKSCYESLNSLILNSPNDVPEDVLPDVCENQTLISTTCPSVPDGACEGTPDLPSPLHDDERLIHSSDVNIPSSASVQKPCSPKPNDGILICTLNTEDPEIPDNDGFISSLPLDSPVTQPNYKQAGNSLPSFVEKGNKEPGPNLVKKEKPTCSFMTSPMFGSDTLPENSPNHQPIGSGVKSECHYGNYSSLVTRSANDVHPSQFRTAHAMSSSSIDLAAMENTLHPCNATHADSDSPSKAVPEHETVPSTSDQEESESDDDILNYSDIEALILDMDLCPDEQDSCFSRKVSTKLYEDKKPVIRLEQCYRSSKQREIASKGALALLYGHRLRHYIKRTEVILGRATEDCDVDIDLRREGPANKISRRQALIKMEENGSFLLQNLGKGSIFLNGTEVSTGQHLGLTSNSLIEVKDMAFVFEINHKYVRQYLINVAKRTQEKGSCFAWTSEGGPE